MQRRLRSAALAVGIVICSAPAAHALNFCFNPGTTGDLASLAVAVRYKAPRPGGCTPINGFDIGQSFTRLVHGTACLNSAGDTLLVAYTIEIGLVHHVEMSLPYPSLTDGFGSVSTDGSGTGASPTNQAHANPCEPQVIPIQ